MTYTFVGTTNVGKSTLINKLIEQSVGEKDVVTTSRFPGTTLDMIDIPLDEKSFMFDTPGIIQSHQMTNYVSENELKIIIPKNEIKQRVYQLNEKQTLFFGGLARIDYVSGGKRPLVCFFSNDLNIHRTKTEKANDLWKSQLGALLSPPQDAQQFNLNDVKAVRLETGKTKRDIMISGLGFITIDAGAKVIVRVPKHVDVILRNSILKNEVIKVKFAVIGNPISHSLSPLMHHANFQSLNLESTYEAINVPVNQLQDIKNNFRKEH